MTVAYDHAIKIGNQGDLVKHVPLLAALRHLISKRPKNQPFIYADCHAGSPVYTLPATGEWTHGIGIFSTKGELVQDRADRKKPGYKPTALSDYDQTLIGGKLMAGSTYLGSSGIAFKVLQASGCPFEIDLWEKEPAPCNALKAHFAAWIKNVHVHNTDGYAGMKSLQQCSFTLLDPPSPDYTQLRESIADLRARGIPFLCWAPRSSMCIKDGKGSGYGDESEPSKAFPDSLAPTACLKVRWHKFGHRAPGCFIACSDDVQAQVRGAVEAVCVLMGYEWA